MVKLTGPWMRNAENWFAMLFWLPRKVLSQLAYSSPEDDEIFCACFKVATEF